MPDKLKHLLSLLDDPDEEIYLQVRNELIRFGPEILPDLEKYWAVGENSLFTTRLHTLIENIRFNLLYADWFSWRQQAEPDLLNGAVLIDQISDHNVSESTLNDSIKPFINETWLEINERLTALEKIRILNYVVFTKNRISLIQKFPPLSKSYFLSNLFKFKTGNSYTISILYLLICRELKLPVYGILYDDLFLLAYLDTVVPVVKETKDLSTIPILFFIHIEHQGQIFGKHQFKELIHTYETKDQAIQPVIIPDHIAVKAVLKGVLLASDKESKAKRVKRIKKILRLWDESSNMPDE
jgi:hypothetical protein